MFWAVSEGIALLCAMPSEFLGYLILPTMEPNYPKIT
jgi:hypothetical protein